MDHIFSLTFAVVNARYFFPYKLLVLNVRLFLIVRTKYLKITNQLTVHLEINKCAGFVLSHNHGTFSTTMKFAESVVN